MTTKLYIYCWLRKFKYIKFFIKKMGKITNNCTRCLQFDIDLYGLIEFEVIELCKNCSRDEIL